MSGRQTVVIVDNVDVDNTVAAAVAAHPALGLNLRAVIVTGRPAHRDSGADIDMFDQGYSEEVRRRNARRLKGFLRRIGRPNIPVFEGLIPPKTLVPHRLHIDERSFDAYDDERVAQTDGGLAAAIDFLGRLPGTLDVIVGGPLSETAVLMREPRLKSRLGTLTCQLGLFGFGGVSTMAGQGLTFNSAADPDAARAVLDKWPGDLYMVPTDVTKMPALGFDRPEDLRALGGFRRAHWAVSDFLECCTRTQAREDLPARCPPRLAYGTASESSEPSDIWLEGSSYIERRWTRPNRCALGRASGKAQPEPVRCASG